MQRNKIFVILFYLLQYCIISIIIYYIIFCYYNILRRRRCLDHSIQDVDRMPNSQGSSKILKSFQTLETFKISKIVKIIENFRKIQDFQEFRKYQDPPETFTTFHISYLSQDYENCRQLFESSPSIWRILLESDSNFKSLEKRWKTDEKCQITYHWGSINLYHQMLPFQCLDHFLTIDTSSTSIP